MDDHRTYGFEPFPLGNRSAPVRAAGGAEGPGARICKASEQRGCVQLLRALHVGSEGASRDLTRKGEGWRVTGGVGRGWPGLHQPSVRVEKGPGRTGGRQPSCFLGGTLLACRSCRRHLSGRFARTWARGGGRRFYDSDADTGLRFRPQLPTNVGFEGELQGSVDEQFGLNGKGRR
jgi:hypothetical protein